LNLLHRSPQWSGPSQNAQYDQRDGLERQGWQKQTCSTGTRRSAGSRPQPKHETDSAAGTSISGEGAASATNRSATSAAAGRSAGGGGGCTFASASRTKKKCQVQETNRKPRNETEAEAEDYIPAGAWIEKKSNKSAIPLSSLGSARNQVTKLSTHRNFKKETQTPRKRRARLSTHLRRRHSRRRGMTSRARLQSQTGTTCRCGSLQETKRTTVLSNRADSKKMKKKRDGALGI
jgi:hypothetical protein